MGLRPARLPTFRHNFVFFDVTSWINIDCIDRSCVRLASTVEQVSEHKSKGIGFKSHVRLTLCLKYILQPSQFVTAKGNSLRIWFRSCQLRRQIFAVDVLSIHIIFLFIRYGLLLSQIKMTN